MALTAEQLETVTERVNLLVPETAEEAEEKPKKTTKKADKEEVAEEKPKKATKKTAKKEEPTEEKPKKTRKTTKKDAE